MADDVPTWAKKRACDLTNELNPIPMRYRPELCDRPYDWPSLAAFARYIADHEQPPVDPLLIEARKIAVAARANGLMPPSDNESVCHKIAAGQWDDHMLVTAALMALRRGKELARERPDA